MARQQNRPKVKPYVVCIFGVYNNRKRIEFDHYFSDFDQGFWPNSDVAEALLFGKYASKADILAVGSVNLAVWIGNIVTLEKEIPATDVLFYRGRKAPKGVNAHWKPIIRLAPSGNVRFAHSVTAELAQFFETERKGELSKLLTQQLDPTFLQDSVEWYKRSVRIEETV